MIAADAPVEVFCSYAHEDEPFLDELKKHLALLERRGAIAWWHDRAIRPGDRWNDEIDRHLDRAGIVLLLVSNDFLASSYCYDVELPRALARHDAGHTRVIPIIVRSADWRSASFAALEVLPKDGKPIEAWERADDAYTAIAVELREAVERIRLARRPQPTARMTRKPVTVVSLALGRVTSDPERHGAMIARCGDVAVSVLGREGDSVRRTDGVVTAFFGVPRLQGDEAVRAVRAASEAVAAVESLAEVGAGAGISTGDALVRAAAQPTVTGPAVDTAADLARVAPAGTVLLAAETYAQVRDVARVERGELPDGTPAYSLVELREPTPFEPPLVGRADVCDMLEGAVGRSIRGRCACLFTLVGPAGIGKSRIVREFRRRAADRATVIAGRCRSDADGATFLPVVEAVREASGLRADDAPADARAKVEALVEGDPAARQIAAPILGLLGLTEAGSSRDEMFWAVRKLFEALARRRPLVVVFEDLDRAQSTLLALVDEITVLSRGTPILLVCLARSEFLYDHPEWGGGRVNASNVELEPLQDDECRLLIDGIVGPGLPPRLVRRIIDRADGNPLFIADTLAMLVGDGAIAVEDGRCRLTRDVRAIAIPSSVHALVAARIERLPSSERDVLERAAVEGRVFHVGAVAALAGDSASSDVDALLAALVRKDIVRPDEARVAGETAFRFRHALIREVAYESLPKLVRSSLHERLADWLERAVGDRPGVGQEFTGIHLERAYTLAVELGRDDEHARTLAGRGGRHLAASGRRAAARGDAPAARGLLRRAVNLLRDDPDGLEARLDLGIALLQSGLGEEAERELEAAKEGAHAAGDARVEAYATLELAGVGYDRHPERGTRSLSDAATAGLSVFEELGDDLGLAKAWRLLGYVDVVGCRWEDARAAYEQAFAHARRASGHRDEIAATVALFFSLVLGPEPVDGAIRRCGELVERAKGSRSVEALGLAALGALFAMVERFDDARRLAAESRAILEDLGQVRRASDATVLWSSVELLAGDPAAAVVCLRRACRISRSTGDEGQRASHAAFLAEALHAAGRDDLAAHIVAFVARHAGDGDVVSQVKWRQVGAAILTATATGDVDAAVALATEAVALVAATDDLNGHADALAALAEALARAGRREEAHAAAADARALWLRKGNRAAAQRNGDRLGDLEPARPASVNA